MTHGFPLSSTSMRTPPPSIPSQILPVHLKIPKSCPVPTAFVPITHTVPLEPAPMSVALPGSSSHALLHCKQACFPAKPGHSTPIRIDDAVSLPIMLLRRSGFEVLNVWQVPS